MTINRNTRVRVRVVGCINDNAITIEVVRPGLMTIVPLRIPMHLVPVDLREPNSEFDLRLDDDGQIAEVLRLSQGD